MTAGPTGTDPRDGGPAPTAPAGGRPGPSIPLHDFLGLEWGPAPDDEGQGAAEATMPVAPETCGSGGTLHGGAIATLIDLTCALAAVRGAGVDIATQTLVTTDLHVRYVGQPRSERVTARAEVVRAGRQLVVVGCEVTDAGGHLVASADLGMMVVTPRRPLPASGREAPPG